MGKRGPAPKPTSLRILHGDRPDRINAGEPVPPTGTIEPPDWLSDDARAVWDRLAPGLIARKVLTVWDADAFVVLCQALARYKQATALLNGSHLLVQGAGGLVKNPVLGIQAEAERTFLTYAARFGMTPSDRQSVKAEVVADDKGGADRLLS
ncbi:phage terminase small subunit P27 family [Lentzea tibetensis]|uniref:Phage terminase small subunit P27 family n=1 Tax=Lentzea tibetensis TaxID=2591470 RepID=A0A563EKM1_9PSEU|nr:phage terminase small subunit P27 family [Lentzea tibetensis]TWP47422.1 phage terminase small subunit P27 family [Lentzea tibetensis]